MSHLIFFPWAAGARPHVSDCVVPSDESHAAKMPLSNGPHLPLSLPLQVTGQYPPLERLCSHLPGILRPPFLVSHLWDPLWGNAASFSWHQCFIVAQLSESSVGGNEKMKVPRDAGTSKRARGRLGFQPCQAEGIGDRGPLRSISELHGTCNS